MLGERAAPDRPTPGYHRGPPLPRKSALESPAADLPATPTRASIDALPGTTLLEFGTDWCGHCRRAQPAIAAFLAAHPGLRLVRIADGPGQRLGRSFAVRLWPTLVLLRDGVELARVVRPGSREELERALAGAEGTRT